MNRYDLETAFFKHLFLLPFAGRTLEPDEIVEITVGAWRRGTVMTAQPNTVGFGNGVLTRVEGFYQIDIYIPRTHASALKLILQSADSHILHFFPANGRGLSLTEQGTTASIIRRPAHRDIGRDGAYLRQIVEVEFQVYVPAIG